MKRTVFGLIVALLVVGLGTDAVNAAAVTVDFETLGTFATPELTQSGLTVTGSNNIGLLNLNGLGVVGGNADNQIDGSEFAIFSFDTGAASDVSYAIAATGNLDMDGLSGEATIEAFDVSGVSLGAITVDNGSVSVVDLTTLFGCQPISKFKFQALNDGTMIRSLTFIPVPVSLRGAVTGMTPRKGEVTCRNLTTKRKVRITIPDGVMAWDCEQAGLVVNPGDEIRMAVTVTGPAH